jgi:hypothetical protein
MDMTSAWDRAGNCREGKAMVDERSGWCSLREELIWERLEEIRFAWVCREDQVGRFEERSVRKAPREAFRERSRWRISSRDLIWSVVSSAMVWYVYASERSIFSISRSQSKVIACGGRGHVDETQ